MRIIPLAVFCSNLPINEMYAAVTLQTLFTHPSQIAIDACYLYCYAISLLIKGDSMVKAFDEV
jgi:ADP-ribosylglycohydrolase